jgi:hypothetical protein
MRVVIPPLPHVPSWRGCLLKDSENSVVVEILTGFMLSSSLIVCLATGP